MVGYINNDAEKAILASVIEDQELIITCLEHGLKSDDFNDVVNKKIYEIMEQLHSRKKTIDLVTVVDEMKRQDVKVNLSDLVGYLGYAISSNISAYISSVKDMAYKRDVSRAVTEFLSSLRTCPIEEIPTKLEEVSSVANNTSSVENLFCQAYKIKKTDLGKGLQVGFKAIDEAINGLSFGSFTLLTGDPSSGKSTFLNQVIAHNIAAGEKAFIYSGELTEYNVLQWFMRTVANMDSIKQYKGRNGIYYDIDNDGQNAIREWIKDKLYIYKQDSTANIENITNAIAYLAKNKDVKLFILDNMMTIENGAREEMEKQKALAKKLKKLAQIYNICVILVAHPKKRDFKSSIHMHDVSGASEVVNLADYEFMLSRKIKDTDSGRSDETFFHILKNRATGIQGIRMQIFFDSIRKRFYTNTSELNRDYRYREASFTLTLENPEDVPF